MNKKDNIKFKGRIGIFLFILGMFSAYILPHTELYKNYWIYTGVFVILTLILGLVWSLPYINRLMIKGE